MHCVCGDVESEKHVLLDCNLYVDVRRRWKEKMNADMYEAKKGYEVNNECIENETMCYLGMVQSSRQRSKLRRFNVHMVKGGPNNFQLHLIIDNSSSLDMSH